ncbi:glycosyltransferase [Thermogemmatispora carboxidivorans]|uniref:glycosyltransferase n=1 Tax=Thermogemmatispora carboxidivorans TaxID=1382306 RepID=UPI0012DD0734|nr:glycosyltransferase [Thermogemmatispora carboxidivorans]
MRESIVSQHANQATETSRGDSPGSLSPLRVCMHVLGQGKSDVRVMRAATALSAAGCHVSVVDLESQGQPAREELQGIALQHVRQPPEFFSSRFKRHALLRAASLFVRGTWQVLSTDADVYHAHDVSALPACYLASRLRRKRLVFEAHEMPLEEHPLSSMSRGRRLLHHLLTLLMKGMIPASDGVITVSPPIVEELQRRYRIKHLALVRNIPPYQQVTRSKRLHEALGLAPQIRLALYQGRLQANRSLDLLVKAARYLDPEIVIVLLGKGLGNAAEELEQLIATEQVGDRVKLLPAVPYAELLRWTASADLGLLVASPDYSLNVQMFLPNKLFEYIMAGVPVLTSALPAVVELVQRYGLGEVVSELTPEAIASTINRMLAKPHMLATMRQNALQAASTDLRWEKEQENLLQLYRQIIKQ